MPKRSNKDHQNQGSQDNVDQLNGKDNWKSEEYVNKQWNNSLPLMYSRSKDKARNNAANGNEFSWGDTVKTMFTNFNRKTGIAFGVALVIGLIACFTPALPVGIAALILLPIAYVASNIIGARKGHSQGEREREQNQHSGGEPRQGHQQGLGQSPQQQRDQNQGHDPQYHDGQQPERDALQDPQQQVYLKSLEQKIDLLTGQVAILSEQLGKNTQAAQQDRQI